GDELPEIRVLLGPVRAMAGRAEGRELGGLPRHPASGLEELDVLGVRARPAALDVRHPELVEHPGDAELVGGAEGDVLALGAVTERRVVQDDRLIAHEETPAGAAASRATTASATSD